MARFALDTNLLIYADGFNEAAKRDFVIDLIARLGREAVVLPTQVLGEFFNVMTRKYSKPRSGAQARIDVWAARFATQPAGVATFRSAIDMAAAYDFQIWDALILCTAAEAGCIALLSEDMQHGFVHRGVTVIDPFAEPMHPLLADALRHPR